MATTAQPASAPPPPEPPKPSANSTSRSIAGATGIMMLTILASRLLGLVRNMVISHRFGQGFDADVYYGAFQIPDLLFYLIAGGALSSAFIPVFTEHLTTGKEEEAWHIFSTVACIMFAVISVFVLLGELFTAPLVALINSGFSPDKVASTVPLTRIVLPAQLCFFLGGLMMGSQQAQKRFLVPALGPVIYNLGIIFGGVVIARWTGVAGLCWGALLGALVGNFGLQLWGISRRGLQFRPSLDWRHAGVQKVFRLMLPVILGVALPQVSIWINRAFASRLGDGPMAALSNANQLMQVPLGIFAQAMAVAIFPVLSAQAAQKQFGDLRTTASGGIRSLLFLTVPASVFMFLLALPIVQVLLQSGKFTLADSHLAASALMFYCIGIFAWSAQSILSRTYYALQDTKTPVIIGTGVTLFFVPMNFLFATTFGMGIQGLALATTVAASLHVVVMAAVLRRRLGGFDGQQMLVSLTKIGAASLAAGAGCWLARQGLESALPVGIAVRPRALLVLTGGFVAGTAVYVAAAVLLRVEELRQVRGLLRRRTS